MVSLVDIGNIRHTVMVRGQELDVGGVSAQGVMILLDRFPELRKIMSGKGDDSSGAKIVEMMPEALGAIIAAGCGAPGDKDQEAIARNLTIAEQVELVDEIFKLTFPQGLRPFVERLVKLTDQFTSDLTGAGQPEGSVKDARGRVVVTK